MRLRSRFVLVLAIALAVGAISGRTLGQEDRTARRLVHVARDLTLSAQALYGKSSLPTDAPPDLTKLLQEARTQYEDVFGTARTQQAFPTSDRSIKALEDRTYDVLEAIWGSEWVKAVNPLP